MSAHMTNGQDINNDGQIGGDETREGALRKMRTAGSVTIDSELFEKLYLNPPTGPGGALQKMLGNPTPIGIIGFIISLTPLSCDLMEWRGSGGDGASDIGAYFFFGGLLLMVAGFMEFILGNSFTAAVFMPFGSFYLTFASTLQPFYGAYKAYGAKGLAAPSFDASIAFFFVFFGVLCFYYLICALRTNVVLVWILFTVTIGLGLVAATFWYAAEGKATISHRCQIGAGAVLFSCCMGGWYLALALLLPTVDFPFMLPVGDLTHIVPSATSLRNKKTGGGGGTKA